MLNDQTLGHVFTKFGIVDAELFQLAREQGQLLAQLILKFTRDPPPFLFLHGQQPSADFVEALLDAMTVRDVDTRPHVPGEASGGVVARHARVEDPSIFTVVPAQPILRREPRARVDGRQGGLKAEGQILGMDAVRPSVAELVVHPTGQCQPARTEKGAASVEP